MLKSNLIQSLARSSVIQFAKSRSLAAWSVSSKQFISKSSQRLQHFSSSTLETNNFHRMYVCNSVPIHMNSARTEGRTISLAGSKEILDALSTAEERNSQIFPLANALQQKAKLLMHHAQNNFTEPESETLKSELDNLFRALETDDSRLRHRDGVMYAFSSYITFQCFVHFMNTGCLIHRSELDSRFTDTEFLMGVMTFCKNLERYALRQATLLNRVSVQCCKEISADIESELLKFNFRNGSLRHTYDGIKYSVRKFEDLLYDLEINCFYEKQDGESTEVRVSDVNETQTFRVHQADFVAANERISEFDAERENVIVASRGIQKAGKSAVYACHRSNFDESQKILEEGAKQTVLLNDQYTNVLPQLLTQGSFTSAMEEWAEGALFHIWLTNEQKMVASQSSLQEKYGVYIPERVYLGALVDFTGEVGRWAVGQATNRNALGVDMATKTVALVQDLFLQLGDSGLRENNLRKKTESLTTNLVKLEKIQYDLAMKPTGKRKRNSA